MHRPKPPLSKGGASAPPRRGDSAGKACGTSYLFPLHYSLKSLPFSTLGCAFKKVPTVNPSVTAAPCQLPFAREPLRVVPADNFARWLSTNRSFPDPPGIGGLPKAPLAKGGWFGEAKPGGFPRLAGFHIGLYFQEVPPVNPSVTAAPCQLPLAREPLGGVSLACRRFLKYLPILGSYGRFFRGYMGKFRKSVWVLAE